MYAPSAEETATPLVIVRAAVATGRAVPPAADQTSALPLCADGLDFCQTKTTLPLIQTFDQEGAMVFTGPPATDTATSADVSWSRAMI